jgi:hypothetical protein
MTSWCGCVPLAIFLAFCLSTLGACASPGPEPTSLPESETAAKPNQASTQLLDREKMTLTLVYDNHGHDLCLQTAWGLSAWLEYSDHSVEHRSHGTRHHRASPGLPRQHAG